MGWPTACHPISPSNWHACFQTIWTCTCQCFSHESHNISLSGSVDYSDVARVVADFRPSWDRSTMTSHPIAVFALNSSRDFGEKVCAHLKTALSAHEEREFEDGEHKARPLVSVRGKDTFVIQSLHGDSEQSVNDKLCRLLFFLGALRDASAERVTAVIPYPVTPAKTEKANRATRSRRRCRIARRGRRQAGGGLSPGSQLSAQSSGSQRFRGKIPQRRSCQRQRVIGDVKGKVAIVIDDMISSGTLARAAEACLARGAMTVYAAASHGDAPQFSPQLLGPGRHDGLRRCLSWRRTTIFSSATRVGAIPNPPSDGVGRR